MADRESIKYIKYIRHDDWAIWAHHNDLAKCLDSSDTTYTKRNNHWQLPPPDYSEKQIVLTEEEIRILLLEQL